VEELLPLPPNSRAFAAASALVRCAILGATLLAALLLPFFAAVMSFIGAFLSMSIAIVLPCVFYLAIHWRQLTPAGMVLPGLVALLGALAGAAATYDSVQQVLGRM
jgi:vesicular inhibitory amino acid transporter